MSLQIAVLVSAGRHPISDRPRRAMLDARALELAMQIPGSEIEVIYAGPPAEAALRDYLGMGIEQISSINVEEENDLYPPLCAYLKESAPDLIMTGVSAKDGEGSGMIPYALGRDLNRPVLSNACTLDIDDHRVLIRQALPKGCRRLLAAQLPTIVTVGEIAPEPRQSAFARSMRGKVNCIEPADEALPLNNPWIQSPAKPKPKRLKTTDKNASAEERLKAITELKSNEGEVLTGLSADEAADALLAYLRREGVIPESGEMMNTTEGDDR